MKIKSLFILLLLSTLTLKAQDVKNTECGSARERAAEDFKKGIRKVYVFGLVADVKYCRILKENYNIEAQNKGCLVSPELKCYSDYMEEMITQERGFGFFQKVRLEAGSKALEIKGF